MNQCTIEDDKGVQHHFMCAGCPPIAMRKPEGESTAYFWSFRHAASDGWKFTSSQPLSKDGKSVGVCPECAKDYKWKDK